MAVVSKVFKSLLFRAGFAVFIGVTIVALFSASLTLYGVAQDVQGTETYMASYTLPQADEEQILRDIAEGNINVLDIEPASGVSEEEAPVVNEE